MKKIVIIGALSLALIASLFLLNKTSAASTAGNVALQINGGSNACSYGTSLNFGPNSFNTASYVRTGNFTGTI
jgi:secreted trypsin-like serine protease